MPASPSRVQAQDCEYGAFGCGHAEQHHQYLEWKPRTGKGSCCNGDDCRPVKARSEDDGSWSVWIPEFRQLGAGAGLRRRRARPVRRWPQPRLQHQADADDAGVSHLLLLADGVEELGVTRGVFGQGVA